jgi:hypothetical protein
MKSRRIALVALSTFEFSCTRREKPEEEIILTIEKSHHYSPSASKKRYGKGDRAKNKKSFNHHKNGKKF